MFMQFVKPFAQFVSQKAIFALFVLKYIVMNYYQKLFLYRY